MVPEDIEAKYIAGEYFSHNPTWDIEHSSRKARDLCDAIPNEYLKKIFDDDHHYVLELGCGAGGVLFHFSSMLNKESIKNTPIGYDISPMAIKMAKQKYGHAIHFYCSKEITLKGKASVILLVDILEHLPSPSNFLRSVKKQSNYLLIRLPLDKCFWNVLLNKLPKLKERLGHIHFYKYRDALNLVQKQGLEIIKYNFTNNFSDKANRNTVISKLMFPIRSLTSAISQKMKSVLWGGNSIVIFAACNKNGLIN